MTKQEAIDLLKPTASSTEEALDWYEIFLSQQKRTRTDIGWWDVESKKVQALMEAALLSVEDDIELPDLKKGPGILMDLQAKGVEWCAQVVADHKHKYEPCVHKKKAAGSHPKCPRGVIDYAGLNHHICTVCGRDRFNTADTIEKLRRKK